MPWEGIEKTLKNLFDSKLSVFGNCRNSLVLKVKKITLTIDFFRLIDLALGTARVAVSCYASNLPVEADGEMGGGIDGFFQATTNMQIKCTLA